ncbi:MAG TPA: MaoC/PaaZ C-terminal domain-containing protein [Pseudomonadales bacterium]
MIESIPYDELVIGQSAEYSKTVSERDIVLFAVISGDANPVHLDAEYARTTIFGERIAHGMFTGSLVSAALAMTLPGPGSIYLAQSLKFRRPVKVNDTITVRLEVTEKRDAKKIVVLDCLVTNQHGDKVATGTAEVIAPAEKIRLETPALPDVQLG